jgi:hypothetical protein
MQRRKQKANASKLTPPPAVSGAEAERRRQAVNARRDIDHKIMTEPGPRWEPQPSLGNEPWRFPRR